MKKTLWIALSAVGLMSCLSGCADEMGESLAPSAVIDGWTDTYGYPVVLFTASFSPDGDNSISDKVIKWGKVEISDGEESAVLTAGPAKGYFPPYRYFSYSFQCQPGKEYTVTATYKDLKATATAYLPYPTPIDSVKVMPIEGNDSLRAATLYFTTPEDVPAYYYLTLQEAMVNSRPQPTMLGTLKVDKSGVVASIPIFHGKSRADSVKFVPQLKVGEKLIVRLNRVEEKVYEFWKDYDNSVTIGTSQFISGSGSISGNVDGGFGIFSAQGSSEWPFIVK